MAIIQELGLECQVLINGRAAVEYPERNPITRPQDHGPDISVSHNYVEAVDGAEFSVEAQVLRNDSLSKSWVEGRKQGLLFALSIDGEKELTLDHINDVSQLCQLEGVIDHATLKKFRFSPLSVVEDSSSVQLDADKSRVANDLGLIEVQIWRVVKIGKAKDGSIDRGSTPTLGEVEQDSMAERALKGQSISHGTTLSPAVDHSYGRVNKWRFVDSEDCPLAVFYFKYRSKDALRNELVLPRARSQSQASITADDSTDDTVDLDSLPENELRRLAGERLAQIKDSKPTARKLKTERAPKLESKRPLKFVRLENGKQAIDLTDD